MFDVPISTLNFMDYNRTYIKSKVGVPDVVTETPRDITFCSHTILGDEIMVVPDALQDERFADNPFVSGPPYIRFYAGYPIRVTSPGSKKVVAIGTLCMMDDKPRDLGEKELQSLKDFGAMVESETDHIANPK
jgi:GAF domain-containing protein